MIIKSYNFRLYPTKYQLPLLKQHTGNSRFLWNKLVEYCNSYKEETNKYPSRTNFQDIIINLKQEHDFLHKSHSQPLQINALRLSHTITNAFKPEVVQRRKKKIAQAYQEQDTEKRNKKLKKAINYAFPKFHRKSDNSDSIYYPQNFTIKKYKIYFAKLGWFNFKKHRPIEGTPKTATIIQDGNQWFLSITCKTNKELPLPSKSLEESNIVGVDVGLKHFATLSDGTVIDNPRTLSKCQKKIDLETQILSKRQLIETALPNGKTVKRSSNRRLKQSIKLHNLYRKCKNTRKDFLHKLSHNMITKYDGIILETLDIQNMLENNPSVINRSISDVSWYEFGQLLEYKCLWNGKYFTKIDKYEPSTQRCNVCKKLTQLSLDERIYKCKQCGNIDDRDINASKNIMEEGKKTLKESTTGTVGREKARGIVLKKTIKREKRLTKDIGQEASAFRQG